MKHSRSSLSSYLAGLWPFNNLKQITAAILRQGLAEVNDSAVNFIDDRAYLGLGPYNPGRDYIPGECCIGTGELLVCQTATGNGPFDASKWASVIIPGVPQSGIPLWTSEATFDQTTNNVCIRASRVWRSIINGNTDNDPLTTTGKWAPISTANGLAFRRGDSPMLIFPGELILRGDILYRCIAPGYLMTLNLDASIAAGGYFERVLRPQGLPVYIPDDYGVIADPNTPRLPTHTIPAGHQLAVHGEFDASGGELIIDGELIIEP